MTEKTLPVDEDDKQPDSAVMVAATYKDPKTGALYVHKDLDSALDPWAEETHIPPPKADEQFGDVESWATYVKQNSSISAFLTWNSAGFRGVLDYHVNATDAGRCQWRASMPFEKAPEYKAWMALCDGQARGQRRAIESLEDLSTDIVGPSPAEFMNLLRNLRATVNATAQTELLPDGTTRVGFSQDKAVKGISDMAMPAEFTIQIPVLKGHDTRYKLVVRLRTSIDDSAHLTLRFTIPLADRALEMVYANQVKSAAALLGDGFTLLRAAG